MKRTFVSTLQRDGEARSVVVQVQAAGEGHKITWQFASDNVETAREAVLRQAPNGDWLVQQDGIVRPVRLSSDRDLVWLSEVAANSALDQTTRWRRVEATRGKHGGGDGQIRSPMTGRVVQLPVQTGDMVTKGQVLVVVEAMKMEHALKAPRNAVVGKIACSVGQLVDGGQELIVLEDPS